MKYTKNLAFALAFSLTFAATTHAQSAGEDPLSGFADLEAALSELDNLETQVPASESTSSETNTEASTASSESESESETNTDSAVRQSLGNRLQAKEVPAGKEDFLLYNIPGAMEYRGMTFLRIDSPRFFDRFQKCDTTDADKTYNALARLKISQGSPLECRESMKYQFLPYKTFRTTR